MKISVTRENPMASLMRRNGRDGVEVRGNLKDLPPEVREELEKRLANGSVIHYDLKRKDTASERTQTIMKEMGELIKN